MNSISTITDSVERICRVMQRTRAAKSIAYAGVFNCRRIDCNDPPCDWSQHSWGNAGDLFPKGTEYAEKLARVRDICNAVVWQATHRTRANRMRKLDVARVIDHENQRQWTPSRGWYTYTGNAGLHGHVEGSPLKTGTPPCV